MSQRIPWTVMACALLIASSATAQAPASADTQVDPSDLYNHSSTPTSQQGDISAATGRNATSNGAINTERKQSRTAAAPLPGRTSFTEHEAQRRLESFGYADVTNLTRDAQGIWRARATKNGQTTDVALDYQGNIVSKRP